MPPRREKGLPCAVLVDGNVGLARSYCRCVCLSKHPRSPWAGASSSACLDSAHDATRLPRYSTIRRPIGRRNVMGENGCNVYSTRWEVGAFYEMSCYLPPRCLCSGWRCKGTDGTAAAATGDASTNQSIGMGVDECRL